MANISEITEVSEEPSGTSSRHQPVWKKVFTVVCNLLVNFVCVGMNLGMWPFINELRIFYQRYSNGDTLDPIWIVYINMIVLYLTGPLASYMTHKLSPRWTMCIGVCLSSVGLVVSAFVTSVGLLCFTYGGITGIGYGLTLTPNLGILQDTFKCGDEKSNRHVFCNALAFVGLSIGMLVCPPYFHYASSIYGRRSIFTFIAYLNIQLLIPVVLFQPTDKSEQDGGDGSTMTDVLKKCYTTEKRFLMVGIVFFVGVAYSDLMVHLPKLIGDPETRRVANGTKVTANDHGNADSLLVTCACFMIFAQLLHGLCSLRKLTTKFEGKYTLFVFLISVLLTTITAIMSRFTNTFTGYFCIAGAVGFFTGIYFPLLFVLIESYCHDDVHNHNNDITTTVSVGSLLPLLGLGALVGLPTGEASSTHLGFAYLPAAIAMGIVSCFMIYEAVCERRNSGGANLHTNTGREIPDVTDTSMISLSQIFGRNEDTRPNINIGTLNIIVNPSGNKDDRQLRFELPNEGPHGSPNRRRELDRINSAPCGL